MNSMATAAVMVVLVVVYSHNKMMVYLWKLIQKGHWIQFDHFNANATTTSAYTGICGFVHTHKHTRCDWQDILDCEINFGACHNNY